MNEQKDLANLIKNVHANLRQSFQQANEEDFKKVWQTHCENESNLKKYANAMKNLATNIWDKQRPGGTRIDWVHKTCKEYFFEGGLQKIKEKEIRRKLYHGEMNLQTLNDYSIKSPILYSSKKLKLLDVGSCYDSFSKFPIFDTIAIDLCPANETVIKCDFLNLQINYDASFKEDFNKVQTDLTQLPGDYFHIVVFSLLLEYIPSPQMRLKCCELAQKLLLPDGLLVIVTSDSHKQHRNMDMIKQWKRNIENLFLQRNKYEKLDHLHCMTFRKPNDSICFFASNKEQECSSDADLKSYNAIRTGMADIPIVKNLSEDIPLTSNHTVISSSPVKLLSLLESEIESKDFSRNSNNLSHLKFYPNNDDTCNNNLQVFNDISVVFNPTDNFLTSDEFPSEIKKLNNSTDGNPTIHINEQNINRNLVMEMTANNLNVADECEIECRPTKCRKIEDASRIHFLSNNEDIESQNKGLKKEAEIKSLKKIKLKRKARNYDHIDGLNIPQDFN